MEVDFTTALAAFRRLPEAMRLPCFDPHYVRIDALRDPALMPVFFLHEEGGHLYYHPLHLGRVPDAVASDIQSAYGYGGPVATTKDPDFIAAADVAYRRWCADRGVLAEFIRFHPLAENWDVYRGDVHFNRETVWIDLTVHPEAGYEQRVRTAIRKASRELEVSVADGFATMAAFRPIYEEGMRLIGATDFYLFQPAYFEAFADWSEGCVVYARRGGETCGAAMFLRSGSSVEYHLSASTAVGRKHSATNLLIDAAARHWRTKGATRLHLGGGTDGASDNPLYFFKAGFSSRRGRFHVGTRIHDRSAYDDLRAKWRERHGEVGGRVLFYR